MTDWNFEPPPPTSLQDREVLKIGTHLVGKRIALLVTGSIAAIKAPLIARSLRRQGADVVAMASQSALRYTTVDALSWSTTNPVVTHLTANAEHLSDINPFDAYLVAPCTYNTINKLRYGIADGVISASLASAIGRMERGQSSVLIAPTMHGSLHNSLLTESVAHLQAMGVKIITPYVAYGKNNLPPETEITARVIRELSNSQIKNMKVLVTGGATPTPIDNVRILTNRFTGKLSGCIAEELFYRGADVKLIQGTGSYVAPSYLPHLTINTYQEYRDTVIRELEATNYQWGIFSAAVADYQPVQVYPGKIPSGGVLQNIELIPTAKVIQFVRDKFTSLGMITFKYQENIQYEKLIDIAQERLKQGYQMIVANRGEEKGDQGEQIAHLVTPNNPPQKVIDKPNIAIAIADWLEQVTQVKS